MNKTELVESIAQKTGLSKKDSESALNAFLDTVKETLKNDDKIQLVGFGSFAARKGINPQTKEQIKIPASKAPVFKAGKALKNEVNE